MKKIFLKSGERRGASLVLAILILMLCALAGTSALTMAVANAGRYSHAADSRQPYYSVTSAALMMVDILDGLKYTSTKVEYDYLHEWHYVPAEGSEPPRRDQTDSYFLNILEQDATGAYQLTAESTRKGTIEIPRRSGEASKDSDERHAVEASNFVKQIGLQCDKIVPYLSVPQEWYSAVDKSGATVCGKFMPADLAYTFTISPNDGSFGTVECSLVMSANYDLVFSFSNKDESGSSYSVNLYWGATVDEAPERGEPVYSYTESGDTASQTIKQSKSVTVQWLRANVTISRGEAENASTGV